MILSIEQRQWHSRIKSTFTDLLSPEPLATQEFTSATLVDNGVTVCEYGAQSGLTLPGGVLVLTCINNPQLGIYYTCTFDEGSGEVTYEYVTNESFFSGSFNAPRSSGQSYFSWSANVWGC
jgi:hypothetical protein